MKWVFFSNFTRNLQDLYSVFVIKTKPIKNQPKFYFKMSKLKAISFKFNLTKLIGQQNLLRFHNKINGGIYANFVASLLLSSQT